MGYVYIYIYISGEQVLKFLLGGSWNLDTISGVISLDRGIY